MNTALLTKLRYITTAKKQPNTIEAIRKRKPAQASATSKVPSGISIMNPSEKTGMCKRVQSGDADLGGDFL